MDSSGIEATIPPDPDLIRTSVTLLRLGPNDTATSILGLLKDDGTAGDLIANDYVFTAILPINELTPQRLRFQVSVAYRKILQRIISPALVILVDIAPSSSPVDSSALVSDSFGTYPVNELLISFNAAILRHLVETIVATFGGSIVGYAPGSNTYQVKLTSRSADVLAKLIEMLSSDSRIYAVTRNHVGEVFGVTNDLSELKALNPTATRAYDLINVFAAWDFLAGLRTPFYPVSIGVIDDPVDRGHPEFNGIDFGMSPSDVFTTMASHGTGVTGIIAANNASALPNNPHSPNEMNGLLAGIPGPLSSGSAIPYTVEVRPRSGNVFAAIDSIAAVNRGSIKTVVNISGGDVRCKALKKTTTVCVSDEVFLSTTARFLATFRAHPELTFVIAAGNDNIDAANVTPANLSAVANVITVGATDLSGGIALYSNIGPSVTLFAPGNGVYQPESPHTYNAPDFGGTSSSAPLVAGTIGLIYAVQPTLTPSRVKGILQSQRAQLNVLAAVQQAVNIRPTFDFAVDWVTVDGNLFGRGNANGFPDFFDDFNDGAVTAPPTSAFACVAGDVPTESGGFLVLRSADVFGNRYTDPVSGVTFLVMNCVLGLQQPAYRVQEGLGSSTITASFRADTPLSSQQYGLQMFTLGTNELVNIEVGNAGGTTVVSALAQTNSLSRVSVSTQINLVGAARIILRLSYNDTSHAVTPSFSIDGGSTFTTITIPASATVLTTGSQATASVVGSVVILQ